MLIWIALALLIIWILALAVFKVTGLAIHILLVAAIIIAIWHFMRR